MTTLALEKPRVENVTVNNKNPRWMILHGGVGAQRYRWSPWAEEVVNELVGNGQWVTWVEGDEAHVKHRCLLAH